MLTSASRPSGQHSAFMVPQFHPLNDQALERAIELYMCKGATLSPKLQEKEAREICAALVMEHFRQGSIVSFDAQDVQLGRVMLILMGEVNIRMREGGSSASRHSPVDEAQVRWQGIGEGSFIGLVHAFSGLSSRFMAQAITDLFVASMTRRAFNAFKEKSPHVALRYFELISRELAMITLDHERQMVTMSNVARSMQDLIDDESGETQPAELI